MTTVRLVADAAVLLDVSPALRHAVAASIAAANIDGVVDIVPGESSVLVRFEPGFDVEAGCGQLRAAAHAASPESAVAGDVTVSVRYDGPDLDDVAAITGLSAADVVRTHLEAEYVVAFMGFAPGFGYLDGLPDALHVPRLSTPRARVRAGSVAIAGSRCCIYPVATPGGWRVIGHTELVLFDASVTPPSLLAPGQRVRFVEAGS